MKFRSPFPGTPPFLYGKRIDEDCQDQQTWSAANRETKILEQRWNNWEIDIIDDEVVEINPETGEVAEATPKTELAAVLEKTKPEWQNQNQIPTFREDKQNQIPTKKEKDPRKAFFNGKVRGKQNPLTEKQKRRAYYILAEELFGWKRNTTRQYLLSLEGEITQKMAQLIRSRFDS